MNILVADTETFFDDEHSLKKKTTEHYCRDPLFEVHGWALSWNGDPAFWLTHEEAKQYFATVDWSTTAVLCHHSAFDCFILNHTYGVIPNAILCTLSMARLLLGNHVSVALGSLAKHYGLEAKNVPYDLFKGRHWHELAPDIRQQVADGACHDVELTWSIFSEFARTFPVEEYRTVDTTIRMFTEPMLVGDVELLGKVWSAEEKRKNELLAELDVDVTDLQSAAKFQTMLEAEGVEVEMKPGKNAPLPAIAKTDEFMKGLLEHPNERVSLLAAARLGVRSTLNQTRAERLGWMARRG